jgi:regulatory protein
VPLAQPFPLAEGVWHKNGAMALTKARRSPPPLDQAKLQELALRYVGRYATTRAKLRAYLSRKLRERGWNGHREPDPGALTERFAELGYVDDAAYALGKSRALTGRGYGKRRLLEKLKVAGVDESDRKAAIEAAEAEAVTAGLRFAERRRIGPFASQPLDRPGREKAIAAMVRAGHSFSLARAIASLAPGADTSEIDMSDGGGSGII